MFRMIIVLLFSITLLGNSIDAQDDSSSIKELEKIFSELGEKDQKQIVDYANFLLKKAKETSEEKEERLYVADRVIPTEETSNKIMAFSRYMMSIQKTTEEKIEEDDKPTTQIKFDDTRFEFGNVKSGDVLEHTFIFENKGDAPLYIYDVEVSCGCTIPNWSKESIGPGEKGELKIIFDTKGKKGRQTKLVKVFANTDPKMISLFIKGEVE